MALEGMINNDALPGLARGAETHNSSYDVESVQDILIKNLEWQSTYFKQLFEYSPDAIVVVEHEDLVINVNRAFCELFQYSLAEVLGRHLSDLIVPNEFAEEALRLSNRVFDNELLRTEAIRRRKDGTTLQVSIVASPVMFEEGRLGICGIYRDITLSKQRQDRLRQLSTVVEQSPASIVITDPEGHIQYVNPRFCCTTGYAPEEVIGKRPSILKSGHTSPAVYKELWETITKGHEWHGEFHNKTKFGEHFWEAAHISPVKDEQGTITHFIAIKDDITERKSIESLRIHLQNELRKRNEQLEKSVADMKHMQASLLQSEKMASIGLLTAGIAHEINNPLAYISSNLNRFQEYFHDLSTAIEKWKSAATSPDEESRQKALSEARENEEVLDLEFLKSDFDDLMQHARDGAERIRIIVDQLRGFSHQGDGQTSEASLNKALEDTVTLAWNEIKYKATVEKQFGDIPPVSCNLSEIKQVFVNLIVNASHAIESNGVITLRTFVQDKQAVVEIEDTGSGIPQEHLRRIFDPFFTTKPVGKGTGLGLWISSTIIHKHHGTIAVSSEVGRGTKFTITLPIHAGSSESKES